MKLGKLGSIVLAQAYFIESLLTACIMKRQAAKAKEQNVKQALSRKDDLENKSCYSRNRKKLSEIIRIQTK